MIMSLAWRNVWRQPRRTILSSSAIAFTTAFLIFMLSLQYGSYASMIDNTLHMFDGYAEIQAPGYHDDPDIDKAFGNVKNLLTQLKGIPGVSAITTRATGFALLSSTKHSFSAQIVGVQADKENKVSTIPRNIRHGHFLQTQDGGEIVLGEELASNLDVTLGDEITMLGIGRHGAMAADSFKVVGIFRTGIKEMDRLIAEIPLQRFQETFSMQGQVHAIVFGGNSLPDFLNAMKPIRRIAQQNGLQLLDWKALQPGLFQAILLDISSAALIYLAMVIVVTFILLNTLFMSVLERTFEFGVMMSLGMRDYQIGLMIWLETILLLCIGLVFGIALGAAVSDYYAHHGLHFQSAEAMFQQFGLPGGMYPQLNTLTLFTGPGLVSLCIVIAGAFPILRLRRMNPVTAMRNA